MKTIKIEVPEGFIIDEEKSTFENIVLKEKKKFDFSVLNGKDWYYIKFKDTKWLHQGKYLDKYENTLSYCLDTNEVYEKGGFCSSKDIDLITEFRLANEEEIEIIKKDYPTFFYKKWSDFGVVKGFYVDNNSIIREYPKDKSHPYNKNLFPTEEEANACLALSQLCQWRDKYNEGWKPDWTDYNTKYNILNYANKIGIDTGYHCNKILAFKTKEIRDSFFEDFKELIEIAKPFL